MQLYVLDRAKNTLATTAGFYNDTHIKTVSAGSSTFEFDIDKTDEAALYMDSGNYIVFNDDKGRSWSFSILSYEEHQTSKTIYCEDVGIELINKNMDIWDTDQAYSFEYYFNLIAKDTPWKLGVNQLAGLSRKLTYTGRDTGLGRLLSVLTGFDKAECQFNIKVQQNQPVEFTVDVYKTIGTIQDNIQIVYGNELNDIKKTESRAEFVTAVQGVGGVITPPEGTEVDPNAPEVKVDFKDLEYKDDNLETTKGDPFLRAVKANKLFNPGDQGYIESYYEYDTQSNTELLNRTITQLNTYSAPQYTYEADVQVIDPTLDIGDTVTIIDHDYNPALYLRARVATLEKSYSDPSKGSITFTNYELLNSSLAGKLRDLQSIINSMPSNSTIQIINSNLSLLAQAQKEAAEKLQVMMESADGKNSLYYNYRPANAKEGDTAFVKNPDSGNMEIWNYVGGQWTLTAGDATFDDLKTKIDKAQTDTQTAITTANTAVSTANQAVSAAGFANDTANDAKVSAADAQDDAANALGQANTAIANAANAIEAATDAQTKTNSLVTEVDDIAGTIETLATTETVDQLAGTVATTQSLAQFAADGLKLKADTTTVNQINGTVNDLKGELDVQADKIAATVTANDVTGMLGNYATQAWTQGKLDLTADGLTSQISSVQTNLDNIQVGGRNLYLNSKAIRDTYGKNSATNVTVEPFDSTTNMWHIVAPKDSGNALGIFFSNIAKGNLPDNSDWSYSADVKGTGKVYKFGIEVGNKNPVVGNISSEWSRISQTGHIDNPTYKTIVMYFDSTSSPVDVYIKLPKLEKGNLPTDWSPAPEDQATVTQFTSIEQTLSGVQVTANNAVTQSQYTQLADQVTSTISAVQGGGANILINTSSSATNGQTTLPGGTPVISGTYSRTDSYEQVTPPSSGEYYYRFTNPINDNLWGMVAGGTYTISGQAVINEGTLKFRAQADSGAVWYNFFGNGAYDLKATNSDGVTFTPFTYTFTVPTSATGIYLSLQAYDYTPNTVFRFKKMKLEKGNLATPWSAAPEDIQSQITQTQSMIDARVEKDGVVNAINISKEAILINGNKVHITGQTTIDSGIITNAMIGNAVIEAAKIKDGAITNAKIANLDGGKITANSITADKLAVNTILVGLNGALGKVTIEPDLISVSQGTSAKATKLDMNGIHFTDANGNDIGFFHSDTMTSGAGGVTLSGNLLVSQRLEVNQIYAVNKSGKGAWVVRDTGVGIGIPGFGILNSSKNGGIFFSDDDGIWLGLHGSWRQIDNLKVG